MKRDADTGLILPVENPGAKTIALLRKLTPLSIAEIRQRALQGRPITGFPCTDEYGAEDEEILLRSVKGARKSLLELGVETQIVVDGEAVSEERLDNRRQMLREIDEELEWEDEVRLAQEEVDQAVAELADEFEEFGWWVPDDMSFLWDELGQELPARHPLEERNLAPMARCDRNDDVLFHDGKGFLVVHLTWSKTNVLPFPLFEEVECDSIADYLRSEYLENAELLDADDGICPECGTMLEGFIEGSCTGSLCPKCGWSVVATYIPPIFEDKRKFTITLLPGCTSDQKTIKAVSHVANCNFLAARQMLIDAPVELFTGLAPEALERKRMLEKACVQIAVSPEFPYDDDGELL